MKKQRRYITAIDHLMPLRDQIEKKAIEIYMQEEGRRIGSYITPTTAELKEGGYYEKARRQLMTAPETRFNEQQRKYLEDMASGMGLKVVPDKEYRKYEKGVDVEWKQKQRMKTAIFEREKLRKLWIGATEREKKLRKALGRLRGKPKREKKPKLERVSLRKPLDIGAAIRGRALKSVPPKPPKHRKPSGIFAIIEPKVKAKPKKRRKRHVERAGKTMKPLKKRIKNGQRIFSFPDDVWKVRRK